MAGIEGPHVAKVEHADLLTVVQQVAGARIPVEPAPVGQLRLHCQHLRQVALVELMHRHASQPGGDQHPGPGRAKAGADHVGQDGGVQLPQGLYLPAALQLGQEGGSAVHVGHQGVVPAPLQAPVMSLHLEVEHLGGEAVTVDLEHGRMILLETHQLGHREGTVLLAPDPDLLLALQHAEQPCLTCRYFGIHTCTSIHIERLSSKAGADQRQSVMMTLSSQNECAPRIGITVCMDPLSRNLHCLVIKLTTRNKPITIGSN